MIQKAVTVATEHLENYLNKFIADKWRVIHISHNREYHSDILLEKTYGLEEEIDELKKKIEEQRIYIYRLENMLEDFRSKAKDQP